MARTNCIVRTAIAESLVQRDTDFVKQWRTIKSKLFQTLPKCLNLNTCLTNCAKMCHSLLTWIWNVFLASFYTHFTHFVHGCYLKQNHIFVILITFHDYLSPAPFQKPRRMSIAPMGEGCPRCGGNVYAAERMLARGRVRYKIAFNYKFLSVNIYRVIMSVVLNAWNAIVLWIRQFIAMVLIRIFTVKCVMPLSLVLVVMVMQESHQLD